MIELMPFSASDITIRKDKQTGDLCLFTVEKRTINKQEPRIAAKEINVKDPNNVIRWEGRPKPGGRGWARNYLIKEDYDRYGLIYPRSDTLMEVDSSYDINKLYTKQELIDLIDAINQKRMEKRQKTQETGAFGEDGLR